MTCLSLKKLFISIGIWPSSVHVHILLEYFQENLNTAEIEHNNIQKFI